MCDKMNLMPTPACRVCRQNLFSIFQKLRVPILTLNFKSHQSESATAPDFVISLMCLRSYDAYTFLWGAGRYDTEPKNGKTELFCFLWSVHVDHVPGHGRWTEGSWDAPGGASLCVNCSQVLFVQRATKYLCLVSDKWLLWFNPGSHSLPPSPVGSGKELEG